MDGAPSGLQITLRTSFLVAFLCVLCSQGGSAHSTPPQGDPLQLPLLWTRLWGLGETGREEAGPVWGNVLLRDLDIHPSRPQFLTSGRGCRPLSSTHLWGAEACRVLWISGALCSHCSFTVGLFCKLPALPGPQFLSLLSQKNSKTPSRSMPKACLFTSTPSPVQGTPASSCPTPALGKQEAG